ncbi:tRNA pseudouridine(38-40) synthase TruA [Helicobacter sp. MIT 21-1697]|uniref:tRNA pseudouridine(38-40) synthase TruA n=1 Tax=Helicobacter sp. MIT 21-1697 TaxID=2993733 RepID=UPI00224B8B0C|nr:tRNA pseudouridine(38-40) synthase TruA [Helicobacter sp. MIT 21-1697]MCX2716261.1 tRNA pseudouridine(38-40) synthase TruA [Helicobacter sp. MIT 21-1697]
MPTYKAVIAYDGSAFSGFALQKDKRFKSVLSALKEGFARVGIRSDIIGAGRTDKGVHATRQVICFQSKHFLSPQTQDIESLRLLLNAKLYPHIMVRSLHIVDEDFHPRFDALWRAYRFLLSPNRPSPFISPYVTYEKIGDRILFANALQAFVGQHNFILFKKNGSHTKNCVRTIFVCRHYTHKNVDVVYVRGSGFLRAQVRLMVGAALACSRGELSIYALKEQIESKKQHYTYPLSPNGLYLCGVGYGQ